jgi:hypothetical protein
MAQSKAKFKRNGDKNISLFQIILKRKCIRESSAVHYVHNLDALSLT